MLLDYSANIFNAAVIVAANKAHLYAMGGNHWPDLLSYRFVIVLREIFLLQAAISLLSAITDTHFDIRPYRSV